MLRALLVASAFMPTLALAQAPMTPNNFVPFTVDANKYQQIDEAVAQLPMSRQAHSMWLNIWRGVEQQAQEEQQRNMQSRLQTPPEPPKPEAKK